MKLLSIYSFVFSFLSNVLMVKFIYVDVSVNPILLLTIILLQIFRKIYKFFFLEGYFLDNQLKQVYENARNIPEYLFFHRYIDLFVSDRQLQKDNCSVNTQTYALFCILIQMCVLHRCECTHEGQLKAAGVLFSHSTVYSFLLVLFHSY